ncbi:MAG: dehydrogenase [Phycisphaerae bacterium]|nr:dehydrogenase [Phycisphaerae bacterium]
MKPKLPAKKNTAGAATSASKSNRPLDLPPSALLDLYARMLLIRRFELAAQEFYKKGEMPGFIHLYIGEEACAVGVCAHLRPTDWITSTHRGHGHAIAKGVSPRTVMAELYGKSTGCCGGRGGSMHLYDRKMGLFGTNGIVGGGVPSAAGVAIGAKAGQRDYISVAFFGDGAVNHGAFHETVNFAAVQKAPVIFVCENNLYATATPASTATLTANLADKALAYGIPGIVVDGNDVLAVWKVARDAVERARVGKGPTLIEAKTYRIVGHHEGDPLVGTYRTQEELDAWKGRCPILQLRKKLVDEWKVVTAADLHAIEDQVGQRVKDAVAFARSSPVPDPATVYDHTWAEPINPPMPPAQGVQKTRTQSWLEAVRDGIAEEMRRDPRLLYFGEGTGERGGSFAHTKGLWQEFGSARMIDTPICELAFTGSALGASATGARAVADLMFSDFMFEAAGQIVLQASKLRYMSNGQMSAPMVIRAGTGAIKSAGPHHSGSYHPIWANVAGLIVVVPSNPADAKGLMKTALRAGDPVIFLEPKALFADKGVVPEGEYLVPFGQAKVVRAGTELTVVACGLLLRRCLEAAGILESRGLSCEVIDLRTIVPLDVDTIVASVAKTGRLLVVDEGYAMCGLGAEVAQCVMELGFDSLDAPIGRLHTDPVAHPFHPQLEEAAMVTVDKIMTAARQVVSGIPPIPRRARTGKIMQGIDLALTPQPRASGPEESQLQKVATVETKTALAASSGGISVIMPHGDLTVTEATVVRWLKNVGDMVKAGEALVEMETEKAVSEVESPSDGLLAEILTPVGTVVKMGQQLGAVLPN